jgi:hypothetical protein
VNVCGKMDSMPIVHFTEIDIAFTKKPRPLKYIGLIAAEKISTSFPTFYLLHSKLYYDSYV